MKLLLTGAAGFIGSHTAEKLLALGHTVYGVDNLSNGKFENVAELFSTGNFVFVEDDFTSAFDHLSEMDAVIHLAAVGSVPRSIRSPEITFEHNVEKFHKLLVAMKNSTCRRLIYASSSSVHGGIQGMLAPKSPYALSKLLNEQYAYQFSEHYGLLCTGLRFFNVYGPRQRADSPYAAVIPKMLSGDPIKIHSPGTQTRDFTYVKDVVAAITTALYANPPGTYDVGYGESRGLLEILKILQRLLPERKFTYEMVEPRPGDVHRSASNSEALKRMGWRPQFNLEAGLNDMLFGGDDL